MLAFAPVHEGIETPAVVKVPQASWSGGRPYKCHENVQDMIRRYGGEQVFGWALSECGPLTERDWRVPPLYRRCVNHVVWRDTLGDLWEVTPSVLIEHHESVIIEDQESVSIEHQGLVFFQDTEFIPDPSANLGRTTIEDWFRTGIRYVAVRDEGAEAAKYLTLAQGAASHEEMVGAIKNAVSAIGAAGYEPARVVVQNIAGNTTSIWIYGDLVELKKAS